MARHSSGIHVLNTLIWTADVETFQELHSSLQQWMQANDPDVEQEQSEIATANQMELIRGLKNRNAGGSRHRANLRTSKGRAKSRDH